ncbi:MAG TPA: O-antigen ligase family protein, partial [Aggregatilineales bacterium]|nr:O-antigen ligase family protein [Aggregatilineales bacterium]
MRSQRLTFVFLAFYLIFIGGSAYYTLVFPIRIFHHAFMSLLMGIWYFRKFRGEGLPQTPLNRPLLAMSAVWVLSTIFGIEPRNAIEGLWFIFLHLTIFFVLIDLFQRGRGRLVIEAQFFMGAIVVLFSGIEIASWYFGLGILPNTQIGWVDGGFIPLAPIRLALAMNISTLLAGYVAPLILLTIGWALTARRRDYRMALWLLAGIFGIILLLTFSRGGLMSVGAGIGTFFLMRIVGGEKQVTLRKWLIPLIVIGAIGFVVIFTISQTRNSGDEVRVDMYRSAVEILLDNPIVGVGVGNYGRAFRDYRTPELARDRLASAHNVYLNTASETGILGVIVSIWLGGALVVTWWGVWKAQTSPARKIRQEAVIAALIGVGVHSMVDVFSTTPLVALIILLVAYSITGHQTVLSVRPQGHKFPALVACVVVVGYAIFFIQTDRAYSAYLASLRNDENALANAQLAQSLDPELNLYTLQIAYLTNTIP